MILTLKLFAIGCCGLICYQDFKERLVHWFLFPIMGIALALIFFYSSELSFFLISLVTNIILVTLILGLLYAYSRFIAKKKFINHSLGIGDILFFYAMAIGFPSVAFIILFAYSLLFALLTYFVLKKRMKLQTVPLAGLMSLFLMAVLILDSFYNLPSLYIL